MLDHDTITKISNKIWNENPSIPITHNDLDDLVDLVVDELESLGWISGSGEDD